MKKVLAFILAISLVFTLFIGADFTASAKETGTYNYTIKNGKVIINSGTVTGDITIPSKIKGYTVTEIADSAFYRSDIVGTCYTVTSVNIPETVTKIGRLAFACCSELTAINVAEDNPKYSSVDGVLFNKDKTKLICYPGAKSGTYTVPSTVKVIEDCAFLELWMVDVAIPTSVKTIGKQAFHCPILKNVYYGGTKEQFNKIKIGDYNNILKDDWFETQPKIHYNANYTIKYYKVSDGKNDSENPKEYFSITPTITLKKATRKGFTFKGWYSDEKLTKKVTKIKKGSTGNKVFYAKWDKNTYKITYKLNSGKNNSKNPKKYTVTSSTIKLKNPTRKGYTFKGWYNGSKKVTQIKKGSVGNITLTAKWKKK